MSLTPELFGKGKRAQVTLCLTFAPEVERVDIRFFICDLNQRLDIAYKKSQIRKAIG